MAILILATVLLLKLLNQQSQQIQQAVFPATNISETKAAVAPRTEKRMPTVFEQTIGKLREQALADFKKAIDRFGVLGTNAQSYDSAASISYRTNSERNVIVEIGIESGGYYAAFSAGPVDTNGHHMNKFLPEGALLSLFYSIREGSDTRRDQSAMNEWHRSTGVWSKQQAVDEALRLATALGHDVSKVVRNEVTAVPLTLKDPAGEEVKVTPFYKVDLYDSEDTRILGAEFRVGAEPPGKITRWFNWPPIKIP